MRRVIALPLWRSLRLRLTLWYVALLAAILLVFSGILYIRLETTLQGTLDETLHSRAALLSESIASDAGFPRLDRTQLPAARDPGENFTRVYDISGALVSDDSAALGSIPAFPGDVAAALRGTTTVRSITTEDGRLRVLTMPLQSPARGVLQTSLSEETIHGAIEALSTILTALVPLMLLIASGGGLFLVGRSLAPVDRITRAARAIEATGLHERLPEPSTHDEIGRLARTLNALIARLEAAFERQRQFTADASHELRTPLTIMQGELDVTLLRERTVAEYRETLADVREEVVQLQILVADLLLLARADGSPPLPDTVVDLAMVTTLVHVQLEPLAAAWKQTLSLSTTPAMLCGTASDLERLVRNLIENAIRYTPEYGTIAVTVGRDDADAVLTVADTGPGINPTALPHLFDRFYRADAGRNRAAGGTGLGLAIAQAIAHRHGGRITVSSRLGDGTTFTVTFPLAPTNVTSSGIDFSTDDIGKISQEQTILPRPD